MSNLKRIVLVVAVVAIAVVAYFVLKPGEKEEPRKASTGMTQMTRDGKTTTAGHDMDGMGGAQEMFTIEVKKGKPVGGAQTITVDSGKDVELTVDSDMEGEAHVHGYNLMEHVAPGKPAKIKFKAKLEGIFELELHGDQAVELGKIEVTP